MKRKFQSKKILVILSLFGCLGGLQAQKKFVDPLAFSKATVPAALNGTTAAYTVVTVGFGNAKVVVCDQVTAKFTSSPGFAIGIHLYNDPSLTSSLVATLVMNPTTGLIYNLSSGVVGTATGDSCP